MSHRMVRHSGRAHLLPTPVGDAKRLGSKATAAMVALFLGERRVALQLVDGGLQTNDNLGPVIKLARLLERAAHEHGDDPPIVIQNGDGRPAYWVSKCHGEAAWKATYLPSQGITSRSTSSSSRKVHTWSGRIDSSRSAE